ncbi:unnamed protein product (macronuclear) [Paramecium tetraurelia]|uniref:C3H1-type domain-containing protein n=1 Tax=Paramecium tetraurelia TaxID=5888 RepID=A0CBJ5_PARTE|nr:uncharacterized protein GSPATT00036945001 [Paramecium tetraurelia]CAK68162.1 unnamed protein product [Paramecium tetraurelia]|eukprot:XP_001435559.1 hypothetical protein (macronuclear) [Paramecium tetraurelia strain d4-2]
MNAKFDALCRFFVQGNCRQGDQCKYSHDTSNIEKVNLDRDDKGKLNLKKTNDFQSQDRKIFRGRGRGRGYIDRSQEEQQTKEDNKIDKSERNEYKQRQQQSKISYDQNSFQRYGQSQEGNENRQVKQKFDRNFDEQKNQNQQPTHREKHNFNQEKNNVNSERWQRNQENENGEDQQQFRQNTRGRGRGRGREGRENTFTKRDQIQDEERDKERGNQSEWQIETVSLTKKVKKNEIQVKTRSQVLNLEQKKNIDSLIQIAGYHFQFLGILKSDAIDFYQIPFKRSGSDIIDEEKKVTISHLDKQFISAFIQEHPNNGYTLIIQFQKEEESFKNLLIFHNVFQQQCPYIISDISMKEIVYTNFEDGQLYTFCKDGLIRIFSLGMRWDSQSALNITMLNNPWRVQLRLGTIT